MEKLAEYALSPETRFGASSLLDTDQVKRLIRSGERHYVYVLCRPDGRPFYVGKGSRAERGSYRALDHEADAKNKRELSHKLNLIRSIHNRGESVGYIIDSFHEVEADSLARERQMISLIGRHDLKRGPLTNQTDGGEGTSNPSVESKERRRQTLSGEGANDPERAEANRWFQKICDVQSVPVKPLGRKYKVEGAWRNRKSFGKSQRQAAALVASAIANRVILKPGAKLPRRMTVDGKERIIENGVARDTLSSDMTVLADDREGYEILELSEFGYRYIMDNIDYDMMLDAGIVVPET